MRYKIVIFDMDGTILNTLLDLQNSCNYALKKHGFPERTYDEVRMFVGNGIPKLISRALPAGIDEETHKAVLKTFMEYYEVHCADSTCAYEGINELLSILKENGIALAVNTNKAQDAAVILADKYFNNYFDYVIGAVNEREKKPAPDGVEFVLEKTGFNKEDAVYIGDSDVDYMTAKNSGIDFIGCDWGFRGEAFLREQGARKIVKKPIEIISLI